MSLKLAEIDVYNGMSGAAFQTAECLDIIEGYTGYYKKNWVCQAVDRVLYTMGM